MEKKNYIASLFEELNLEDVLAASGEITGEDHLGRDEDGFFGDNEREGYDKW